MPAFPWMAMISGWLTKMERVSPTMKLASF